MLILRKMCGKRWKMTAAICTGSSACKSVALEKTGNNPYTYNCDELYMASPLEKSRELAVLIITQNMDCPVLFYGSCWTTSSYRGRVSRRRGSKVRRVAKRKEGIRIGLSLNSANRRKKDRRFMLSSVCKNSWDLVMDPIQKPFCDYHVT